VNKDLLQNPAQIEERMTGRYLTFVLGFISDKFVVAATSSGEKKSFRGRQQRLPKRKEIAWNDLSDDVTSAVSDSKLSCSRNPFSDFFLDCIPSNLSL